jgi:hypothetical protein
MLDLSNLNSENKVSLAKDPFKADCITHIAIFIRPNLVYCPKVVASIDFTNGNTSGCQKFEGEDFGVVTQEMQTFINSLDKT